MLSQIVFIASFLAVCIRNSESLAEHHIVLTDDQAVDMIQQLSHGIVPILLMQDWDPLATSPFLKDFINTEYNHLIIVINVNNLCTHTVNAISKGFDSPLYPALHVMKEGQVVKRNRVTKFLTYELNAFRDSAQNSVIRTRRDTSLSEEILNNMRQATQHPGIQMGNPVEHPLQYPVVYPMVPGMIYPGHQMNIQMTTPTFNYQNFGMIRSNVSETTLSNQPTLTNQPTLPNQPTAPIKPMALYPAGHPKRKFDQGESSRQPGHQMNIQPTLVRPTEVYQERQTPETRNLLDSMDKPEGHETDTTGDSPQILSQLQGRYQVDKRSRHDEGPSGS